MRVFLLTPGRTGSTTFYKAFSHCTNFSSGQQTNWGMTGRSRVNYPKFHIESDARLLFFADWIEDTYAEDELLWVKIERPLEEIASSYSLRLSANGIIPNFARGILGLEPKTLSKHQWAEIADTYVQATNFQIEAFLKGKKNVFRISIQDAQNDFRRLWDHLGCEGDLESALGEWKTLHNKSKASRLATKGILARLGRTTR